MLANHSNPISPHGVDRPQDRSQSPLILGNIASIASTVCQSQQTADNGIKSLSQSQKVRFYLQSLARELLPTERVAKCFRQIAPHHLADGVDVVKSQATGRHRYKNLLVCGRLWQCPVCAARITEARRRELSLATSRWPGKLLLVTYTLRHTNRDRLVDLLAAILAAYRKLKSGREWQEITSDVDWAGSVRSLEVTDGTLAFDNGWHVHIHELVFIEPGADRHWVAGLEPRLKRRWSHVLDQVGHDASYERGVTVETADQRIAEYIAKYGHDPIDGGWTVAHELTKAPSKMGKKGGRTPFQLLSDYGDGDAHAGALYVEYAAAFAGHKQLTWSRGIRERLGLDAEQTDEALADPPLDQTEIFAGNLAPEQWRVLLKLDLRAGFIEELDRTGNWDAAFTWLAAQGVPEVIRVDATDMMWQEYERQRGPLRSGPVLRNSRGEKS